MSVLIKNMKMPSRCWDCTFAKWSNLHQTKACNCGSNYFKPCFEDNSEEFYTKRADFCPLVEAPVPHGHLIDADALMKSFDTMEQTQIIKLIKSLIDLQPIVIEAEGERK